jgi:DNA-binding NarL/FixJ family response regulator
MRVLVADDNALIRLGLRATLSELDDVESVEEAANGAEAVERVHAGGIDVVLLDVRMPVRDGLSALPDIVGRATVLMLTNTDDLEIVAEAMRHGASGYIIHGSLAPDALGSAIRACLAGGTFTAGLSPWSSPAPPATPATPVRPGNLSAREAEVMDVVAQGLTNTQIARTLFLSEKTVKNHINSIFSKLGATTRAQAVALWLTPSGGSQGPVAKGPELGPGAVVPGAERP